jgi:uncharacterized integral membrane protein
MTSSWWKNPRIVLPMILALLFVIVLFQNTDVVTLRVLFWELGMSQVILIPGVMAIGFVLGYLVGRWTGRGRRAEPPVVGGVSGEGI